jgi:hypothetical protein
MNNVSICKHELRSTSPVLPISCLIPGPGPLQTKHIGAVVSADRGQLYFVHVPALLLRLLLNLCLSVCLSVCLSLSLSLSLSLNVLTLSSPSYLLPLFISASPCLVLSVTGFIAECARRTLRPCYHRAASLAPARLTMSEELPPHILLCLSLHLCFLSFAFRPACAR